MTLRLPPEQIVSESSSPLLAVAPWWERVRLGDVANVINGAAFKSSYFNNEARGEPLVRIRDVRQDFTQVHYDGPYESQHVIDHGDLLVGMDGDFRVARWAGSRALLNQRVCRVQVFNSDLYSEGFLMHVLQPYLDAIHARTSSITVKHLSSRTIQDLSIPLPPRSEQERIVAAIEERLSRLDMAEVEIRSVRRRAGALSQRVIDSMWDTRSPTTTLDDLLQEPLANGRSVPTDTRGFPVLRLTALRRRRIDLSERKRGAWDRAQAEPFLVQQGDFLVSRGNGSLALVGRGGLVDDDPDPVAFPDTLIRVRLRPDQYDVRFLSVVWDSTRVRQQIEGCARTTAGIYKVNQEMLRQIVVPKPPKAMQSAIACQVEDWLNRISRMSELAERCLRRSAQLRRSILAAAFAGKLVPQNPDDELASVLLERIRAERAAATPKKRTRKARAS